MTSETMMNEVFIVTNPRLPDNPIVYVNESFCNFTGYCKEDFLGKNCRFMQGGVASQEAKNIAAEMVSSRSTREFNLVNYKKNGEPFRNVFTVTPNYNNDGELCFFIGRHQHFEKISVYQDTGDTGSIRHTDRPCRGGTQDGGIEAPPIYDRIWNFSP